MNILECVSPGQLQYRKCNKPEPSKGRITVRIKRIGVCGTDLHAYRGNQPFFSYPRILGHELSGEVEDEGGVSAWRPGDAVCVLPYFNCGVCVACRAGRTNCCVSLQVCGVHVDGGMVEYLSVPETHLLPGNGMPLDKLALVEPLAIGAHAVRRAGVQPGEFVLVVGAGPIGLGAMEFARLAGARVIALDISESRLHFCKHNLKVDFVINGRSTGIITQLKDITAGDMPHVVMDATGNRTAINNAFQYMAHGGRYILVGLQSGEVSFLHPEFHKREGTLMSSRNATREDFLRVMETIRSAKVNPEKYITHRVHFLEAGEAFEKWLQPEAGVIKAMIEL